MACKADIKKAILDLAFKGMFEGRNTFTRISDDTIEVNNVADNKGSKATSLEQAKRIAEERLKTTITKFKNQINGYVNQFDAYSPVTVNLRVSQAYIDYEYNKQPVERQTEPTSLPSNSNPTVGVDELPEIQVRC